MWVYDIFVSVCARNTAAKWYLPHQEKQHLTQTGRGWAGRPAKRDLTKSLLRKLHERRMHSDQIDHRSIFAKSHTSQEGWKEGESECQRKLRGAEPAKVPVRCQPGTSRRTGRRALPPSRHLRAPGARGRPRSSDRLPRTQGTRGQTNRKARRAHPLRMARTCRWLC